MNTCKIEGCQGRVRGWGWCGKHWTRWRKYGDPLVVKKVGVDFGVKGACGVDGCERPYHANGYCGLHGRRVQKHGNPHTVPPITGRPIKGDVPSWDAVHKRLSREIGSATESVCVDCQGPAQEWSYTYAADADELIDTRLRLAYSLDLTHYVPRCVRCHRRFDTARRKLQASA